MNGDCSSGAVQIPLLSDFALQPSVMKTSALWLSWSAWSPVPLLQDLGGFPPLSDSLNCGAESAEVQDVVVGFSRAFSMLNLFSLDSLC